MIIIIGARGLADINDQIKHFLKCQCIHIKKYYNIN